MQTIETMRERRDALRDFYTTCVNEVASGGWWSDADRRARCALAVQWLGREMQRYASLIASAAIAEGRQRGYRERTLAEATSDRPLSELGRMSDAEYRRSLDEEYMRKQDRAAAIERKGEREDNGPARQNPNG